MKHAITLFLSYFIINLVGLSAQTHTKSLPESTNSPEASIEDVSWIQGAWNGEGLGGQTEEVWTAPSGGSMMGSFKLIKDDQIVFYEFCLIREVDNTLLMQIKHFDQELTGWETKEESVLFPLVEITDEAAYFDGLTFYKKGTDELSIYVLISENDDESEYAFHFTRAEL